MRKIMFLVPVAASAALVMLSAGPAFAADTDVTFEITAGDLEITAPAGSVPLGSAAASPVAQDIGANLGDVTVTDGRGGTAGWVATVISTAFTPAPAVAAVPASAVLYGTPAAAVSGTATVTPADANGPVGVMPVQTATLVSGANTATWDPTVTVTVPAGAQPAVYTATLTHAVS